MPRRTHLGILALMLLTILLLPLGAHARPAHKKALVDFFGAALPKNLQDCRTCHLPDQPGADESEKPHNVFGARLAALRKEFRKAGKSSDLVSRLQAVADEDSDGDGIGNFLELLSGHAPGDPKDKPATAELTTARQKLAELRARPRDAYAWQPFEPVKRPSVPKVKRADWERNPIDAFLAAEHERHGLEPRPEASKPVLLRRVYLDLIGLPPTTAELHAFLDDRSPDGYEKVVDRLLASPRYGERWGRHWMDVWRYADWAGYGAEVRDSQPHIWHWRDWIIESLNADKGYDRMVQEMLAADELAPGDADAVRATGFLVRNWYKFNRNVWLERTVEHTGKAFLGVTLNCARCHDHMFDPFAQKEFYAFRAFFEPEQIRTDRLRGVADTKKDGIPRIYDAQATAPTYLFTRGDERHPDKSKTIAPAVPAALGGELDIEPVALPKSQVQPDRRDFVVKETLAASEAAIEQARQAMAKARRRAVAAVAQIGLGAPLSLVARAPAVHRALEALALAEMDEPIARARHVALKAVLRVEQIEEDGRKDSAEWKQAATETAKAQRETALLEARRQERAAQLERFFASEKTKAAADKKLADARTQRAKIEAEAKQPITTAYVKRNVPSYPATSTGRRLALARWITDKNNPLAARVAMNHIWLRHFGKGIVPTEFDFGRNGRPPSHPALLDWLADEFLKHGWSMKHMHRLIVTSRAYRMDSQSSPGNVARDRDNLFLWRMNPRRAEGEVVRDSLLYVAGQLDLTMGGPDIDHHLGLTSRRRSLYFRHAAEKQMEFLTLFDAASVTECYRRSESIVPQQALALANSSLALAQARLLAHSLSQKVEKGDMAAFVKAGFEQVLSRPPTDSESATCVKFLDEQTALLAGGKKLTASEGAPAGPVRPAADPVQRARENLIHVLMNHHDFVTIR
ncbi:MAG TPA: DUF1549 and DUF1553 domain-containing protein [Gemmataceae bacterium]|jgi:hypothetical protein